MINRIQSVNNRSNYKQNFGMALVAQNKFTADMIKDAIDTMGYQAFSDAHDTRKLSYVASIDAAKSAMNDYITPIKQAKSNPISVLVSIVGGLQCSIKIGEDQPIIYPPPASEGDVIGLRKGVLDHILSSIANAEIRNYPEAELGNILNISTIKRFFNI